MSTLAQIRPAEAPALPANVELEAALLGAFLIENDTLRQLRTPLNPADFYEPGHARIFEVILDRLSSGGQAIAPQLKPYLEADPALKPLGGVGYLAKLTANGHALLGVDESAAEIAALAARRRAAEYFSERAAACRDLSFPLDGIDLPDEIRPATKELEWLDLKALAGTTARPKEFIIPRIAPAGEVTLFNGPGSVGKSLLCQQLASAMAAGVPTLGLELQKAPAIYVTCEDDADQLHFRQERIAEALGVDLEQFDGWLLLLSLKGADGNALAYRAPDGRLIAAPLYFKLRAKMQATGAKVAFLDNLAHLFTGNENDRADVTAFVNLLNRLAGETNAAVILLGHPNKAGDSYSGSTAWLNAVRSQVVMGRPTGDMADEFARTLTVGKTNYARTGEALKFRWNDWAFCLDSDIPAEQRAKLDETIRAASDNAIFLACLAQRNRERRAVSEKRSPSFAPSVFENMPESKGIGKRRLEAAMDRLFRLGKIERSTLWNGTDRKPVSGLREVASNGAGNGAGNTAQETRETAL